MQTVFNLRMEPIQTHDDYPKYARSETKPVVRARQIIDQGAISDQPCSACVDLEQDCYRWEGNFSKCAYCTSKDKNREFCHLPGQEASPAPERRKRRKITGNIYAPGGDAASTADTMMSGTLVSGATPFPAIPKSGTRSVRARAPSPEPSSAMTGIIDTGVVPPVASEAGSNAALERITALENQVSTLEAKFMELLVKLDEVSSCVSTSSTPRRQTAAGASSPTATNITFGDLQSQDLPDAPLPPVDIASAAHLATREWVEGPKTPVPDVSPMCIATQEAGEGPKMQGHTIEHPEGYRPVNCSCSANSVEIGPVLANELKAEGSLFSDRALAGRGNLF